MAKNKKKNKQQQKPLPTAAAKAVITAPTASTIAAPVIATAPKATMVAPQINKPPLAHAPQATVAQPPNVKPVVTAPPPTPKATAATPTGKLTGTVVARVYHAKTEAVLYGRIYCPETDKYYVAHSSNGIVPPEGSSVTFTDFVHERAGGQKTTAAKNIVVIGTNKLVSDRMATINALPVYTFMKMEDFLNMSGEEVELANIVGSTPEGEAVYYLKDSRV